MEGSKILVFKRANEEGSAPLGMSAAVPSNSPPNGSPAEKEKHAPLGRVREAALALERLAEGKSKQERGTRKRWAETERKPGGEARNSEAIESGHSVSEPIAAAGVSATGWGAEYGKVGTEETRSISEADVLTVESCRQESLVKQPEATVSATPLGVLGGTTTAWGVALLRPTRRIAKTGPGVTATSTPATDASAAAGGIEGEGARQSVKSMLQMWTHQEASAHPPASQPIDTQTENPATVEPLEQPSKGLASKAKTSAIETPLKQVMLAEEPGITEADGSPAGGPQYEAHRTVLEGQLEHLSNKQQSLPGSSGCRAAVETESLSCLGRTDLTPEGVQSADGGGLQVASSNLAAELPDKTEGDLVGSPSAEPVSPAEELSAPQLAEGAHSQLPAVGTAALATPPGVAGVFFRPKKVAWRTGPKEDHSVGKAHGVPPSAPLGVPLAVDDVVIQAPEPAAQENGATETFSLTDVEPAQLPPPVPLLSSPTQEAPRESHSSSSQTQSRGDPSPSRSPVAPSPVTPVLPAEVQTFGSRASVGATMETEPASPPPASAAATFSSPVSQNRGPVSVSPLLSHLQETSPVQPVEPAALASSVEIEAVTEEASPPPPTEHTPTIAFEDPVSPVAVRPLLPASSFFSPRSVGKPTAEAVATPPQSVSSKPQPSKSPLPATPVSNPVASPQFENSHPGREQETEEEHAPASPVTGSPASPRLASASLFFSPQANRKQSTVGAVRSLFSTGALVELGRSPSDLKVAGEEVESRPEVELSPELLEENRVSVEDSPGGVNSPPPRGAAQFFGPQKLPLARPETEKKSGVGEQVGSGLRAGDVAPTQEAEGVLYTALAGEMTEEGHGVEDSVGDVLRPISPPPPSAAGFFSPSKRSFPRALSRAKTGALTSAPVLLVPVSVAVGPQMEAPEEYFDAGGEATPYASANCSPMSVQGSSPIGAGFGPSRRLWEVFGEGVFEGLRPSDNRSSETDAAKEAGAMETVGRPCDDTWQSDGAPVMEPEQAPTAGKEEGSAPGDSHVADWHSPDHQKVRTPPFRSGMAGAQQQRAAEAPVIFPHPEAGEPVPAETQQDMVGEANRAEAHGGKETNKGLAEGVNLAQRVEEIVTETVHELFTAFTPSPEPSVQPSLAAPRPEPEQPKAGNDLPGALSAPLEPTADAKPPPSATAPETALASAPSPSPSKAGLWSTFVGGFRGMITPPKLNPPKPAGLASGDAPEESGSSMNRMTGELTDQASGAVGLPIRATWASPQKERQAGATRTAAGVTAGGSAAEVAKAPEPSFAPAPVPPLVEHAPAALEEARGGPPRLPPGSPKRQGSASPRTPPLASQAFGFAAKAAPRPPANQRTAAHQSPKPAVPELLPDSQPEPKAPVEIAFSPLERTRIASIFEHFQVAASQLGARAFFSGSREVQKSDAAARPETLTTFGGGAEGPVERSVSLESADSCFELPPSKLFRGSPADDGSGDVNGDVSDPIVRAVMGEPGGGSPLVNYYDLAETAPSVKSTGVKIPSAPLPVNKPVEGEVPVNKRKEGVYTGGKRPAQAGVSPAYPWASRSSPILARWLDSDRDETASFWAPSPKPEPTPNWARGTPVGDGAFVGRKTGGPFPIAPTGAIPLTTVSGDVEAVRPAPMSPEKRQTEVPASARTRKGPVPTDQRKPRHSPNKQYFPARVNELRGTRGGDFSGADQGRGTRSPVREAGVNTGRDSFLPSAGPNTGPGLAKRGRSASVIDRATEQRSANMESLKASRSLTPQRFRTTREGPNRDRYASPNLTPSRPEAASPTAGIPAPANESPTQRRPVSRRTAAKSPALADLGENKENATEVSKLENDVSKEKQSEAVASDSVGDNLVADSQGPPDGFDRALSLRDPNREPAVTMDYVEMSTKVAVSPTKAVAAAESASLWEPVVSDVDPQSAWAHLAPADLVSRPLPSDVDVCRCYVVREQAAKMGASALYKLFTEEGEGREDRLLLVARHVRHVGRSEFHVADSAEQLGAKGRPRCVVRANFVGSKYTAHAPDGDSKLSHENKLAEVGYATTATSLAPTVRRMLVTLPAADVTKEQPLALVSKPPAFNQEHKRFEISYGGRAKDGAGIQQSVKNFQLVHEADEERTLLLFGKVGKDVFVMDFRPPLTATQAFAICLSSIDSKLCCAL